MRMKFFYFIWRVVDRLPYSYRLFFWIQLYFYNRRKDPNGSFTLNEYKKTAL